MPLSSSMSARLMHQHETIRDLTAGLPVKTLQYRILPDKWSVFENIAHLAAYQPVFISRLERIGREPSPAFERYVAKQEPAFPSYLGKSLEDGLLTGREWTEFFLLHEAHHLYTIYMLVRDLRK